MKWCQLVLCIVVRRGSVRKLCPTSKKTTVLCTQEEFNMMAKIGLNGQKADFRGVLNC